MKRRGTTLLELIVASGVLLVMVFMTTSAVVSYGRAYHQYTENRSRGSHHDSSPGWTPDGKGILLCRDGSSIVLLSDGRETVLVDDTGGWNTTPSIYGNDMVFMSNRDGNPEIYLKSLKGKGTQARRLTHCPAYESNPRFSSDGKRILFCSDREDDHVQRLYSMNPDGSQVEALTPKDAVSQGIWLP